MNICCNSSTVSSFTSGGNLLLTNQGQLCLNTTTPQSGYQFTMSGSASYNGIYLNGTSSMIYMKNLNNSTSDATAITISGNSVNWQIGAGNSAHTIPNGFYFYGNSAYRAVITSAGRLGVNTTSPSGAIHVVGSSTVARFSAGTCDLDIWINTGGLLGRRAFIGPSTADSLTLQTNGTERMTITSDGWVGVGTASARYPLEVAILVAVKKVVKITSITQDLVFQMEALQLLLRIFLLDRWVEF